MTPHTLCPECARMHEPNVACTIWDLQMRRDLRRIAALDAQALQRAQSALETARDGIVRAAVEYHDATCALGDAAPVRVPRSAYEAAQDRTIRAHDGVMDAVWAWRKVGGG